MRYQQSLEIEKRLNHALDLITEGSYSTPQLAELIGVSIPTVSRMIAALRARGHRIDGVRETAGKWSYRLSTRASIPAMVIESTRPHSRAEAMH